MAKVRRSVPPVVTPSSRSKKKTTPAAASLSPANKTAPSPAPSSRTKQKTPPAPAPSSMPKQADPVLAPSLQKNKTPPMPAPSSPAKLGLPTEAVVIEIPGSPTPPVGARDKKGERKRAPPSPVDLDDIEMWTPRQKRRIDEDCCILPSDPLAAPAVVPTAASANEDVAVIAERGKVACRDYPHPRYACAKYPFGSTPHESHCEQCFCYVCDIAAPCVSWKGNGHCHASNDQQIWKTMRGVERQRQGKTM